MKKAWILDVLSDLKAFAQVNGLPALAEQLTETADLAALEIASAEEKARLADGDDYGHRSYFGEFGESRRA